MFRKEIRTAKNANERKFSQDQRTFQACCWLRIDCFEYARVGIHGEVYENALVHELRKRGLAVVQQRGVVVRYDDVVVGEYTTDLLVEDVVVVELKAVKVLDNIHLAQCLNYLRATDLRLCLLLNFGSPHLEIRRVVHGL